MPTVLWDASGLAKRYTEEDGAQTADALFTLVAAPDMIGTPWTYAEVFSIRHLAEGHDTSCPYRVSPMVWLLT